MTYFQQPEQQPEREQLFLQPVVDEPEDDFDEPEDPPVQQERAWRHIRDAEEREERLLRRDRLRLVAGVSDFLLVILGSLLVLALVALLVTLVVWVLGDITERFPVLQNLGASLARRPWPA